MGTDRDWELWGSKDPYYAVLAAEEYRRGGLDTDQREAFFRTGSSHVEQLLRIRARLCGARARSDTALDFGCGVGRLVIPLAAHFGNVAGVDISPSMLEEAQRNCEEAGLDNVSLLETSRFLGERGSYDLVHSVLVFQHIRPRRGEVLLAELLSRVAPGGFAAIQLMFSERYIGGALARQLRRLPLARRAVRMLRGQSFEPLMEMNPYDLGTVLSIFQDRGFSELKTSLAWLGDVRSVTIFSVRELG